MKKNKKFRVQVEKFDNFNGESFPDVFEIEVIEHFDIEEGFIMVGGAEKMAS